MGKVSFIHRFHFIVQSIYPLFVSYVFTKKNCICVYTFCKLCTQQRSKTIQKLRLHKWPHHFNNCFAIQRYHSILIIWWLQLKPNLGTLPSLSFFFPPNLFFSPLLPFFLSPTQLAQTLLPDWSVPFTLCPWSCHHVKPTLPQEGFGVGVIILWGQCNIRNLILLSRPLRGRESLREA